MSNISINIGDTVRAHKFVYDTDYRTTGVVIRIECDSRLHETDVLIRNSETGHEDWYRAEHNPPFNSFTVIAKAPHKMHGQRWEPCSRRGCDIEPVCNACSYCERHCQCDEMPVTLDRETAEMIARGEEGAMREAGWGGIGGSQGSGE